MKKRIEEKHTPTQGTLCAFILSIDIAYDTIS
jgi:hypothetical protein